jgi:hypothetical protein
MGQHLFATEPAPRRRCPRRQLTDPPFEVSVVDGVENGSHRASILWPPRLTPAATAAAPENDAHRVTISLRGGFELLFLVIDQTEILHGILQNIRGITPLYAR